MCRAAVGAFLALTLSLCLVSMAIADCTDEHEQPLHYEAQIHKDIFCAYNSDYRPVKNHTSTVTVRVRFAIKYLSFDSLEEMITVHSWVAIAWKDEFLNWNPDNYGGVNEILVESHEIWIPRMALFNADATMYPSDQFYTTCTLNSTGHVVCVPHIAHYGICRTSLRRWPYDSQNCSLYFGSWMHKGEQINFTFYKEQPVVTSDYQDGPGWKLTKVLNDRLPGVYRCCPHDTYPMLRYTFILKREAAGPAAIVVVPSIVIVLTTLTALTMSVKDYIRVMLLCFSLFGHFTFLSEIGYNVPKHGTDTPIILLFVRDSMLVTLTAILVTLLLMSLIKRENQPPRWITYISRTVTNGPGRYVIFTEFDTSDIAKATLTEEDGNAREQRKCASDDWVQFANILNCLMFTALSLVYLVLICTYIPQDDE